MTGSVCVSHLSKTYRRYPNQWARLREWLLPWRGSRHDSLPVLRDINFTLAPGEAVGIVGANGAGKSTLLKIITGTTLPSAGTVIAIGNISSLLELGMGFHPDFSGRQNVYMAGQLLGLTRVQLDELLPAIEAFAEIGDYIDQPVRVYSSGMQMRLAFSVATARRPDILIVDEALAVGDSYFQHKSFDRIRAYRDAGTTLLLVSHDRQAIQSICDRAILLHGGQILRDGAAEAVLDFYHALQAEHDAKTIRQEPLHDGSIRTISGTGEASIAEVLLLRDDGIATESILLGTPVTLQVRVNVHRSLERLVLGYMIKDRFGQPIYGINTHRLGMPLINLEAGEQIIFRFNFAANLGKGSYSISLSLSRLDSHVDKNYEWRDRSLIFQVLNTSEPDFVGCAWLDTKVVIERSAQAKREGLSG